MSHVSLTSKRSTIWQHVNANINEILDDFIFKQNRNLTGDMFLEQIFIIWENSQTQNDQSNCLTLYFCSFSKLYLKGIIASACLCVIKFYDGFTVSSDLIFSIIYNIFESFQGQLFLFVFGIFAPGKLKIEYRWPLEQLHQVRDRSISQYSLLLKLFHRPLIPEPNFMKQKVDISNNLLLPHQQMLWYYHHQIQKNQSDCRIHQRSHRWKWRVPYLNPCSLSVRHCCL